jgi:hypothetical protein
MMMVVETRIHRRVETFPDDTPQVRPPLAQQDQPKDAATEAEETLPHQDEALVVLVCILIPCPSHPDNASQNRQDRWQDHEDRAPLPPAVVFLRGQVAVAVSGLAPSAAAMLRGGIRGGCLRRSGLSFGGFEGLWGVGIHGCCSEIGVQGSGFGVQGSG